VYVTTQEGENKLYKFIKTKDPDNEFSKTNITYEVLTDDADLDELFEEFCCFLRGCGFAVGENYSIEILDNDTHKITIPYIDATAKNGWFQTGFSKWRNILSRWMAWHH